MFASKWQDTIPEDILLEIFEILCLSEVLDGVLWIRPKQWGTGWQNLRLTDVESSPRSLKPYLISPMETCSRWQRVVLHGSRNFWVTSLYIELMDQRMTVDFQFGSNYSIDHARELLENANGSDIDLILGSWWEPRDTLDKCVLSMKTFIPLLPRIAAQCRRIRISQSNHFRPAVDALMSFTHFPRLSHLISPAWNGATSCPRLLKCHINGIDTEFGRNSVSRALVDLRLAEITSHEQTHLVVLEASLAQITTLHLSFSSSFGEMDSQGDMAEPNWSFTLPLLRDLRLRGAKSDQLVFVLRRIGAPKLRSLEVEPSSEASAFDNVKGSSSPSLARPSLNKLSIKGSFLYADAIRLWQELECWSSIKKLTMEVDLVRETPYDLYSAQILHREYPKLEFLHLRIRRPGPHYAFLYPDTGGKRQEMQEEDFLTRFSFPSLKNLVLFGSVEKLHNLVEWKNPAASSLPHITIRTEPWKGPYAIHSSRRDLNNANPLMINSVTGRYTSVDARCSLETLHSLQDREHAECDVHCPDSLQKALANAAFLVVNEWTDVGPFEFALPRARTFMLDIRGKGEWERSGYDHQNDFGKQALASLTTVRYPVWRRLTEEEIKERDSLPKDTTDLYQLPPLDEVLDKSIEEFAFPSIRNVIVRLSPSVEDDCNGDERDFFLEFIPNDVIEMLKEVVTWREEKGMALELLWFDIPLEKAEDKTWFAERVKIFVCSDGELASDSMEAEVSNRDSGPIARLTDKYQD